MGNACGCFGSEENVNAIKSIMLDIEKQDGTENIDALILLIDSLLLQIKAPGEAAGSSSHLEPLASVTTSASELIDYISREADKMSTSKIIHNELGDVAVNVLKAIGETHLIFLMLSLVASSLQRYLKMRSNASGCMELLEKLVELAKDLQQFKEAVPGQSKRVLKSVHVIVEGVVICCDYITKQTASRYFIANSMESQLIKTEDNIRDLRASLDSAVGIHTASTMNRIEKQITRRLELSPLELLDFEPEGIDDQVSQVKEKLDMEGSEPEVAVVLWGHGGVGKSTLAASVMKTLNWRSIEYFKFSRVMIDQRTPDKISHIIKLQRDIIFDFGGGKVDLRNPAEGRQLLPKVMEDKFCFILIDNVVDSDYIEELLPKKLLKLETSDSDPLNQQQKSKVRILITSRENNVNPLLNIKIIENYHVETLSAEAARNILSKTILHGEALHQQFDEIFWITKVAQACQGVPLLLSVFGKYLKVERSESSYKDVLQALQKGKLDKYSSKNEENLSEKLLFVYDKMKDDEAKEAFLDICIYFQDEEWDQVAHVVGETTLQALQKRDLVSRSESNTVIVHDILRSIGTEKAKLTRLTNYEEFSRVKDDITRLHNIKGLALMSTTYLTSLDCKQLNAMRNSLRVLKLGDWVRLDAPCVDAFEELRYLQIGDLKDFPFKDASQLKNLAIFYNRSKPGMELGQLPPNVKHISHQVPYRDCYAFTKNPLKDVKTLERFHVGTRRSVCLPQGFKFPASLVNLKLAGCQKLPKRFGKLNALESLILDKCDMECLPQGLEQLTKLRHLSMEHCTNLITLPDRFGSSDALISLSLRQCTRLEELPAGLETLRALKELNIAGCENLSILPDIFNELSALQKLDLTGCISLKRLPDSFGRLHLQSLDLDFLASLEELPESFGDLPCLTKLSITSCKSLKRLPKTFARLRKLEKLKIQNCSNLTLSDCSLLTDVPHGFQALPNLKILGLYECNSVLNLPIGFGELSCLEVFYVQGLPLSSLPDGLGKLKNLKELSVSQCNKLENVSQDFQNLLSLQFLRFRTCPVLDGAVMDKIVKFQRCWQVHIEWSTKLIQRWHELIEENEEHCMVVLTGKTNDAEEFDRARRVSLFGGECIQLDITRQQLIEHSSMSLPNPRTTVVVMSGELHQGQFKPIAKNAIEKAIERAKRNCSGQLRFIHVCPRAESDDETPNKEEEMERIRQILMLLPPGLSYHYAIPSNDLRRLRLMGYLFHVDKDIFFHRPDQQPFACYMADLMADDQDSQILKFYKFERVREEDITGTLAEELPGSDEENEVPDKIEEFINFICEGRAHQSLPGDTSAQDPPLQKEPMFGKFIEALNNCDINHFVDSNQRMVEMDQLEGKTLAVIMIDLHSPECIKLQEVYGDIQNKSWNFEAIWIALSQNEDFGFGTYSRAIQHIPGIALPDPKLINLQKIKDKSPRIIIFNQEGDIVNLNALPLIMSWGADAYPFAENGVSQMVSKTDITSSWDVLFHGMNFSTFKGIQELNEIMSSKGVFLYAEPPCPKLRMNSMLEQFAQTRENLVILYLGNFFDQENGADSVNEMYENAMQNMQWPKLSFSDMMKFWYRCKCLSTYFDKVEEEVHPSLTSLKRILKHLFVEKRGLILLDRDGVVTGSGKDVVELMCRPGNEMDDDVDTRMKRELRESIDNGKCSQVMRTFFKDEISDYPHHPHPLMLRLRWEFRGFSCDVCGVSKPWGPHEQRAYRCSEGCDWDLCFDCWQVFAKEQVKASND